MDALPRYPDAPLGRDDEIAQLLDRLRGGRRLQAITGPAGIGKTRLAVGVARALVERGGYREALLCDTEGLTSAQALATAVLATLGSRRGAIHRAQLCDRAGGELRLSEAVVLLVDGAEQLVVEALTALQAWVDAAPEVAVLVTGRSIAAQWPAVALSPLSDDEAVRLLRRRASARTVRGGKGADMDVVARAGGNPLAIEVLAAAPDLVPGDGLDARLQGAWNALASWERSAVLQAAVFEGGFPLDAAEAVMVLPGDPFGPTVLDALHAVVRRGLLVVENGGAGPTRYRLLRPALEVARRHLAALEAEHPAAERHARWFARHGARWAAGQGGDAARLWARLRLERRNLAAAGRWGDAWDPNTSVLAAVALAPVVRGAGSAEDLLEMARRPKIRPSVDAARLELARARALRDLGRREEAAAALTSALDAASGHATWEARIGVAYSRVLAEQGDADAARSGLDRAVSVAGTLGAPRLEAEARLGFAELALLSDRGRARGREQAERALTLLDPARDPELHLRAAIARAALGLPDDGADTLWELADRAAASKARPFELWAAWWSASGHHAAGDLALARRAYARSEAVARALLDAAGASACADRLEAVEAEDRDAEDLSAVAAGLRGSPDPSGCAQRVAARLEARIVARTRAAAHQWHVASDGSWFKPPDGDTVDLKRRETLTRVVAALAAQHGDGVALGVPDLADAGWPGADLPDRTARNRVYVALSHLRKLGLTCVVRGSDGYRLDPDAALTVEA